ncbi:MAG: hypothetical protein HQK63_12535 [Desulfamplus sp.]|nr:hypothetical protein [Desulfamplus sp.]
MPNFVANEKGLQIKWKYDDYPIDIFSIDAFEKECLNERGSNRMYYSKDEIDTANYSKTVRKQIAILEYPRKINSIDIVDPGTLLIIFKDNKRKSVEDVIWIDEKEGVSLHPAVASW